jgi:hypothetical protein
VGQWPFWLQATQPDPVQWGSIGFLRAHSLPEAQGRHSPVAGVQNGVAAGQCPSWVQATHDPRSGPAAVTHLGRMGLASMHSMSPVQARQLMLPGSHTGVVPAQSAAEVQLRHCLVVGSHWPPVQWLPIVHCTQRPFMRSQMGLPRLRSRHSPSLMHTRQLPLLQMGLVGAPVQSADSSHSTQMPTPAHIPAGGAHSPSPLQARQRPAATSHTGRAAGQSPGVTHALQVLDAVSQTGVAPPQWSRRVHCTQRPVALHAALLVSRLRHSLSSRQGLQAPATQMGRAGSAQGAAGAQSAHWPPLAHTARGGSAVAHSAPDVQPAQRPALQMGVAMVQSELEVQVSHRPMAVMQRGLVPPQCTLSVHCTQRPDPVWQWGRVESSARHWSLSVQAAQIPVAALQIGVSPSQRAAAQGATGLSAIPPSPLSPSLGPSPPPSVLPLRKQRR